MQITRNDRSDGHQAYDVTSPSGNTYTVAYEGLSGRWDRDGSPEIDPEYDAGRWSCTCPAHRFHPDRDCKHIAAVIAQIDEAA